MTARVRSIARKHAGPIGLAALACASLFFALPAALADNKPLRNAPAPRSIERDPVSGKAIIIVGGQARGDSGVKALNPQPLPPKERPNALNPQPLPPKERLNALNPQPLPPKERPNALNPQPLPPKQLPR
ncbi:hypothetical protein [Bradyrhizobium sp. NP1]|uniref:hypothetical protein n=1 Tax=Bradyrhizobium sp. NP1 TaxID=3049772 RepID=UPI0025A60593|nr:hypothetical protein [Bradyrhizobium sp. NP1]WJR78570.1 hypothetical protein QOU61_01785 [Bradyrhizobium sp. NP1]